MDVTTQKQKLEARRAEIVGDLAHIESALDAPMPKDWEDRSSERQGDEVLEALGHAEQAELLRIDAALKRITDGSYGVCVKCEDSISDERLRAVPDAALCKKCAR